MAATGKTLGCVVEQRNPQLHAVFFFEHENQVHVQSRFGKFLLAAKACFQTFIKQVLMTRKLSYITTNR